MARQAPPAKPFKVLIVEDESLIAMELTFILEDAGYEVIGPVATVRAALEVLNRTPPDACVLDVNLRGEHSAAVAAALKSQNVPFLLSSAYERDKLEQIPAFFGIVNIGKPAPRNLLLSGLASFFEK